MYYQNTTWPCQMNEVVHYNLYKSKGSNSNFKGLRCGQPRRAATTRSDQPKTPLHGSKDNGSQTTPRISNVRTEQEKPPPSRLSHHQQILQSTQPSTSTLKHSLIHASGSSATWPILSTVLTELLISYDPCLCLLRELKYAYSPTYVPVLPMFQLWKYSRNCWPKFCNRADDNPSSRNSWPERKSYSSVAIAQAHGRRNKRNT